MKKLLCLLLVMIISISLVACDTGNDSKTEKESEPKANETLEKCPENKNGIHDWDEATCEEPAKCDECGAYKDDKLGNHSWEPANCTQPATCYHCGECKDDKLGSHEWWENENDIRECYHC